MKGNIKGKYLYFSMKDEFFLDKYNEIWEEVSNTIKKKLIENLYTIKNI